MDNNLNDSKNKSKQEDEIFFNDKKFNFTEDRYLSDLEEIKEENTINLESKNYIEYRRTSTISEKNLDNKLTMKIIEFNINDKQSHFNKPISMKEFGFLSENNTHKNEIFIGNSIETLSNGLLTNDGKNFTNLKMDFISNYQNSLKNENSYKENKFNKGNKSQNSNFLSNDVNYYMENCKNKNQSKNPLTENILKRSSIINHIQASSGL